MNAALNQALEAAIAAGGEGFAEYLASRRYTPEQITLGLLKAWAKEFREKRRLVRVERRSFAGALLQDQ